MSTLNTKLLDLTFDWLTYKNYYFANTKNVHCFAKWLRILVERKSFAFFNKYWQSEKRNVQSLKKCWSNEVLVMLD
jgi:hypothetical protein